MWNVFWTSYDEVINDPDVDVVYNPLANCVARAVESRGHRGGEAGADGETLRS